MSNRPFLARFVGGPNDGAEEMKPLDNHGRLPDELHVAVSRPIGSTIIPTEPSVDTTPSFLTGVYRLNSARQVDDPEGLPGDMIWTEATYTWKGYR